MSTHVTAGHVLRSGRAYYSPYMPARKRKRGYTNGGYTRRPYKRRKYTPRTRRNYRTGGYTGIEMKFADIETGSDAFAQTWATMEDATNDSISGVAIGTGESQRIGRKYFIHSIHIKCSVFTGTSEGNVAPADDIKGRICLVWDKQTNGAQLTATDVMDGGQADDTLAFRNLQHTARFVVLWDKKFTLRRATETNEATVDKYGLGVRTTPIMTYNKVFSPPIQVICDDVNATISDISDNSLHIIGVANLTSALLNMQVRMRYKG